MGIKLMVEVLNHYRGPDHKFRWLIAFAEAASDRTRTGWPSRELMVRRTERSPSRVSHLATELVAEGILKRQGGGGRHRGNAKYTLLPLVAQSAPKPHPETPTQGAAITHPEPHSQSAPRPHSQSAAITHPEDQAHSSSITLIEPSPSGGSAAPTAQTVLGGFIDWDRANGGTLTRRTIGQLAKQIAALLAEGIDGKYIKLGLAEWRAKEQHPSTLDSFVNAAMNGRGTHRKRESTGDRALAEAAALKKELA